MDSLDQSKTRIGDLKVLFFGALLYDLVIVVYGNASMIEYYCFLFSPSSRHSAGWLRIERLLERADLEKR